MALPQAAQASLDRIFKSGEYVCRPHRQIFVEHTFTNSQGQVTRKVTREDLARIAANINYAAAETGDLPKIGIGHTYDDVLDDQGNVVKKFSEKEQPEPIGYAHNATVEQLPNGKWALFADEWVQKVITNERGEPVDGAHYVTTFPGRSPEYYPARSWINWLALLRREPALQMGLDIAQYALHFPQKLHYCRGSDGASLVGAVEDSRGCWRYAATDSEGDEMPPTPAQATPASPPDDRPPIPAPAAPAPAHGAASTGGSQGLPPIHQQAAEQYSLHSLGMHHSHAAALLHHAHAMYGAQLGLNPDKHTPHVPGAVAPAAPMQPNLPGAAPMPAEHGGKPMGAAPAPAAPPAPHPNDAHQQNSPVGLKGDSSWQHGNTPPGPGPGAEAPKPHEKHNAGAAGPGVPGGGNAYIPGSTEEERRRMSAVQQGIEHQQFASELEKLRYELEVERKERVNMQREKRKSEYERDLTGLLGMGWRFDLAEEVKDAERWDYAAPDCQRQIERIKKNYAKPSDGDGGSVMLYYHDGSGHVTGLPHRERPPQEPEGVTREMMREAHKYSAKHGIPYEEALQKLQTAKQGAA